MSPRLYYLFSQTILHCGSGQSVGIIDQPIIRDRASNLPIVPGSTVRGVLRSHLDTGEKTQPLFGPAHNAIGSSFAGALSISDAHILLLPVRSVYGILAYVSCPFILRRYQKDCALNALTVPPVQENQACYGSGNENHKHDKIVLEDLDLIGKLCDKTTAWAEHFARQIHGDDSQARQDMQVRFLILPDNVFSFLAETATDIRTRIRIKPDTGVVDGGALWSEENLPAETLLWGVFTIANSRDPDNSQCSEALNSLIPDRQLLSMGGNVGIGNGLVTFFKAAEEDDTQENGS